MGPSLHEAVAVKGVGRCTFGSNKWGAVRREAGQPGDVSAAWGLLPEHAALFLQLQLLSQHTAVVCNTPMHPIRSTLPAAPHACLGGGGAD
jgi:hypothetical protein